MIKFDYNFKDEDVVFYYINMLKTISQDFLNFPLDLFYNIVT